MVAYIWVAGHTIGKYVHSGPVTHDACREAAAEYATSVGFAILKHRGKPKTALLDSELEHA